jgi:outer membrane protein assembly factor BamB
MGLGVDDSYVYYGSKGTPPAYTDGILYKVLKNGGSPAVLATGLNRPLNLTLDDQRVYWSNGGHTDMADGTLVSIAKTGGAITTIAASIVRPGNPVLAGDRIFWTTREQPTGRVLSAKKDGTDAAPTEIATGLANPSDLEVAGTTLVWATQGQEPDGKDALVERASFDGTGRMPLAKGIASPSYQLGITADAVFVGSFVEGNVRRLPFDLSGPTIIGSALGQPQELVADGANVFAATGPGHRIVALPANGGTAVVVADGQIFPSYIAMDADYIYWTDGPLDGAATIRKAKKPAK